MIVLATTHSHLTYNLFIVITSVNVSNMGLKKCHFLKCHFLGSRSATSSVPGALYRGTLVHVPGYMWGYQVPLFLVQSSKNPNNRHIRYQGYRVPQYLVPCTCTRYLGVPGTGVPGTRYPGYPGRLCIIYTRISGYLEPGSPGYQVPGTWVNKTIFVKEKKTPCTRVNKAIFVEKTTKYGFPGI